MIEVARAIQISVRVADLLELFNSGRLDHFSRDWLPDAVRPYGQIPENVDLTKWSVPGLLEIVGMGGPDSGVRYHLRWQNRRIEAEPARTLLERARPTEDMAPFLAMLNVLMPASSVRPR